MQGATLMGADGAYAACIICIEGPLLVDWEKDIKPRINTDKVWHVNFSAISGSVAAPPKVPIVVAPLAG
jgi:hypothetical protein